MSDMEFSNHIPSSSVGDAVKLLADLYGKTITKRQFPLSHLPAPFLWGPPGVGKSDLVKELAKQLGDETGKKVSVTEVRLLLFTPIDLRGVPVADAEKQFTKWLLPKIFAMDAAEDVVNILFLDELSAAPPSIQAAAYQITLDRKIGEHSLPENTIVICAGNRTGDYSVAYKTPLALANRLMHFQIVSDFSSWEKWAIRNRMHPLVLGYISFDHSKLYQEEVGSDTLAYASPRTWEFVSRILRTMDLTDNVGDYFSLISSCIGTEMAMQFVGYCKIYQSLPSVDSILNGVEITLPKRGDVLYALLASLIDRILSLKQENKLFHDSLENLCEFAWRLPPDYGLYLLKNLAEDEAIGEKLVAVPSFTRWLRNHQDLWD